MKKLLIAANSGILAKAVSNCLSGQIDILVCRTGTEAAQHLQSFCPDVIAVDMMLPGIDGVGVLKMAQSLGIHCQVVAFTTYISDYMLNALELLKVESLIRLPCDLSTLTAQIQEVAARQEQEPPMDTQIRSTMTRLGFQLDHGGITMQVCLQQYLLDPRQKLMTQVYPAAAEKLGGTVKQVERAMSRAVDAAWQHRDERIWRLYFPANQNGVVPRPTNMQVFTAFARCLLPWRDAESEKATG